MSKTVLIVIWILLLITGVVLVSYYGDIKTVEKQLFIKTNDEAVINATGNLSMFLPNMRFDTNSISYSFIDCSRESQDRMKQAFQIISDETTDIIFYEDRFPKIIIYCSPQKEEKRNSTFVAGEGGPNKVILLDLYPLIIDGKIYLYGQKKQETCDYPIVEIHELLHVFGFDHINDSTKVLYPYVKCDQKITQDIVDELKRLYTEKPKADLTLQNLSATMHGGYLDFNVTILNRGLVISTNVSLNISSGGKTVEIVSIENLSPGISQTMTVKNLLIKAKNSNQVDFKVTSNSKEYFYENNQLTATVTQ